MEITIQNKEQFISNLLTPISKVSDSVVMQLYPDKIACLCSACNNIVLYEVSQVSTSANVTTNLNITDVKRLIKVLNCIEDNTVKLIINNNNIEYKSTKISNHYSYQIARQPQFKPIYVFKSYQEQRSNHL